MTVARSRNGVPVRLTIDMETLKIARKQNNVNWDYDQNADVLYISIGPPAPAEGIDLGDGVIARIDGSSEEVVGVTILGMRSRLLAGLHHPSP